MKTIHKAGYTFKISTDYFTINGKEFKEGDEITFFDYSNPESRWSHGQYDIPEHQKTSHIVGWDEYGVKFEGDEYRSAISYGEELGRFNFGEIEIKPNPKGKIKTKTYKIGNKEVFVNCQDGHFVSFVHKDGFVRTYKIGEPAIYTYALTGLSDTVTHIEGGKVSFANGTRMYLKKFYQENYSMDVAEQNEEASELAMYY